MCDLDTEKTQLEESLLRCANFQMDSAEKNMKEIAIKLFAVSLQYLLTSIQILHKFPKHFQFHKHNS